MTPKMEFPPLHTHTHNYIHTHKLISQDLISCKLILYGWDIYRYEPTNTLLLTLLLVTQLIDLQNRFYNLVKS